MKHQESFSHMKCISNIIKHIKYFERVYIQERLGILLGPFISFFLFFRPCFNLSIRGLILRRFPFLEQIK